MACPKCGHVLEFWKDDIRRKCCNCGREVANPRLDLACAQWCRHAAQCIGQMSLEDRILARLHVIFGGADERWSRTLRALERAKRILATRGGNAGVIIPAVLLHLLPLRPEATAGKDVVRSHWDVRSVLEGLDVDARVIEQVAAILARQAAGQLPASHEETVVAEALGLKTETSSEDGRVNE